MKITTNPGDSKNYEPTWDAWHQFRYPEAWTPWDKRKNHCKFFFNQLTGQSLSAVIIVNHGWATHNISQYDLNIWIGNQILLRHYMVYVQISTCCSTIPPTLATPPPNKKTNSKLHLWHQDPKIEQFHQKLNPPRQSLPSRKKPFKKGGPSESSGIRRPGSACTVDVLCSIQNLSQNPKSEIQNPKSKIRNPKSKIQNTKSKIQNPKSEIQNPKFAQKEMLHNAPKSKIPNPKSKIQNPKSEIQNPKSKIRNPKSKIQNPKSEIQNPKSKIQNPKSEIQNPKSKIQNPKSKIRNPKSKIQNPNPKSKIPNPPPKSKIWGVGGLT